MRSFRPIVSAVLLSSAALFASDASAQTTIIYQNNPQTVQPGYRPGTYTYPVTVGTIGSQTGQNAIRYPYNPLANPATAVTGGVQPSVSLPAQQQPGASTPDDLLTPGRATQQKPTSQDASGTGSSVQSGSSVASLDSASQDASKRVVAGLRLFGPAKVLDGNTLVVGAEVVVLNGADAPEKSQLCFDDRGLPWQCGRKATERLIQLVGSNPVSCVGVSQAKNGIAALCRIGQTDLGRTMVSEGLAVVPRLVAPAYIAEEAAARQARVGVWGGTFKRPWDFRAGR